MHSVFENWSENDDVDDDNDDDDMTNALTNNQFNESNAYSLIDEYASLDKQTKKTAHLNYIDCHVSLTLSGIDD